MTFKGIFTALVTPFTPEGVDRDAFSKLVEWQIAEGIDGLVPCGTTGESPTLSYEEHRLVIDLCIEAAAGKVPVVAGTGANSTEEAILFTKHAKKAGASGALIVVPYYNKPTQEGIYQHFKAIHDAVDIPIILYNIPGRSVVNMSDELIARLAKLPGIVGVKDATGDLARVATLRNKAGEKFIQLSGEDMTAAGFNAMGGQGCISVASNVAPKLCAELQKASLAGDFAKARQIQDKLVPLISAMFCETSPGPVKYALSLMGKCQPILRLPLVLPSEESKANVADALKGLGIQTRAHAA